MASKTAVLYVEEAWYKSKNIAFIVMIHLLDHEKPCWTAQM